MRKMWVGEEVFMEGLSRVMREVGSGCGGWRMMCLVVGSVWRMCWVIGMKEG